jgi:hypothetical protein
MSYFVFVTYVPSLSKYKLVCPSVLLTYVPSVSQYKLVCPSVLLTYVPSVSQYKLLCSFVFMTFVLLSVNMPSHLLNFYSFYTVTNMCLHFRFCFNFFADIFSVFFYQFCQAIHTFLFILSVNIQYVLTTFCIICSVSQYVQYSTVQSHFLNLNSVLCLQYFCILDSMDSLTLKGA